MSGEQGHGARGATGVEDTLKDFWATRPRRPRKGRKIAGVAAGVGRRYGIDPIVVRVAFVVATFYGGAGVLFYLLGWLLLPEQDDEAAPFESMVNRRRSSTSTAFTILLCLALIPAFWFFIDNEFSGLFGLLIVAGALYLLHRSRGHIGRPESHGSPMPDALASTAQPPPATPAMTFPTTPYPAAHYPAAPYPAATPAEPVHDPYLAAEPEPPAPTGPPAWDPLGAAPFAWDLPEPTPPTPEPPEPRRKSKVGLFTVGAVLVVGGIMALVSPYASGWINPQHIIGVTLAVLALGMVGGAFLRSGRGLIGLAVPLSVIGIGLTVISPDGWHGVGDINVRPVAFDDVQSSYQRTAGTITLDLTGLPASGESVHTRAEVDAGDILIIVPRNAEVDLECKADVGDLECLGQQASGPESELTVNEDGGPGGLEIEVDAEVGAGHVEVRRG